MRAGDSVAPSRSGPLPSVRSGGWEVPAPTASQQSTECVRAGPTDVHTTAIVGTPTPVSAAGPLCLPCHVADPTGSHPTSSSAGGARPASSSQLTGSVPVTHQPSTHTPHPDLWSEARSAQPLAMRASAASSNPPDASPSLSRANHPARTIASHGSAGGGGFSHPLRGQPHGSFRRILLP